MDMDRPGFEARRLNLERVRKLMPVPRPESRRDTAFSKVSDQHLRAGIFAATHRAPSFATEALGVTAESYKTMTRLCREEMGAVDHYEAYRLLQAAAPWLTSAWDPMYRVVLDDGFPDAA